MQSLQQMGANKPEASLLTTNAAKECYLDQPDAEARTVRMHIRVWAKRRKRVVNGVIGSAAPAKQQAHEAWRFPEGGPHRPQAQLVRSCMASRVGAKCPRSHLRPRARLSSSSTRSPTPQGG